MSPDTVVGGADDGGVLPQAGGRVRGRRSVAPREARGLAAVVARIETALATGAPVLLTVTAQMAVAAGRLAADAVPASLREVEVTTGCAADCDGWLVEAV